MREEAWLTRDGIREVQRETEKFGGESTSEQTSMQPPRELVRTPVPPDVHGPVCSCVPLLVSLHDCVQYKHFVNSRYFTPERER